MLDAIGPIYRAQSFFSSGAEAGYRGQIGRNSAIPHALANNIIFQPGDVLVTGANAPVWGYNSELERTMMPHPLVYHELPYDPEFGLYNSRLVSLRFPNGHLISINPSSAINPSGDAPSQSPCGTNPTASTVLPVSI